MTDSPLPTVAWLGGIKYEIVTERVRIEDLPQWKRENGLVKIGGLWGMPLYWPVESLEKTK